MSLKDKDLIGDCANVYPDGTLVLSTFDGEDVKAAVLKDREKFQEMYDELMGYLFKQSNITDQQRMDISVRLAAHKVCTQVDIFGDWEE